MKSNPSPDPLQRDIREWSNMSEKGQGRSQPKGKGKGKGKRKHPGKGNQNQGQAESPSEDGQRTLGDFGIKRQRVEFVGDVQENDDFETPRVDRAAYVSTTLQMTCYRGAKVSSKWLQERSDDHNIQSDYKFTNGLDVRIQ